jgi:hypothetical protein
VGSKSEPAQIAPNCLYIFIKSKLVPGFDELAVTDSDDGDAVEFRPGSGRLKSQTVAFVFASHRATHDDFVAFGKSRK